MKICAAQIKSARGDISKNIRIHQKWIEMACAENAGLVCFPELSLSGYEPAIADAVAMQQSDPRLELFQRVSNSNHITVCLGVPLSKEGSVQIAMLIFQPDQPLTTYGKQFLHDDELPYFSPGVGQVFIQQDHQKICPAICYESLLSEHQENAWRNGADVYLASVAKSAKGTDKAEMIFPVLARDHHTTVIMVNGLGPSDNFIAAGRSAAWTDDGQMAGQLNDHQEGLLIFDTKSRVCTSILR